MDGCMDEQKDTWTDDGQMGENLLQEEEMTPRAKPECALEISPSNLA